MMDNISIKRRRYTSLKTSGEGAIDRLSSLADDILLEILSLCALTVAARTAVLCRRWRYLWTQITSLSMISDGVENDLKLCNILDNVLIDVTSSVIHKLNLQFSEPQTVLESWLFVRDKFFHQISARNVEIISVDTLNYCSFTTSKVRPHNYSWDKLLRVPSCIFQATSLIELEIGIGFCIDLPNQSDTVLLPRLKKINIQDIHPSQGELFGKLIKSCPSLEELVFIMISPDFPSLEHGVLEICAHNLITLLTYCYFDGKVVIDTPKLENLTLYSYPKLKVCTNSKALLQVHRQLDLQELMQLLYSSPRLEVLMVRLMSRCNQSIDDQSWVSQNSSVPNCLLYHVKRIDLEIYEQEIRPSSDLIKYLLRNARVLEQLNISTHIDDLSKELQFCKEIYGFERCSSCCRIEFSSRK